MNEIMDTILLEALDLLEQGLSVDEITARYPAQAAELRPFLLTAVALSRLATQPTAAAEAQSKRAFLAAGGRAAERPRAVSAAGLWRRLAMPVVALVAVLFLGAAGLVGASTSAMPGDALYGAKRLVEQTRLGLATDPERAAALREQFRRERAAEIARLLSAGQKAEVAWTGTIEALDGDAWRIGGVPARITADTFLDGTPFVGALVEATGRTAGDSVTLSRVTVLAGTAPAPSPTPPPPTPAPAGDADMDEPPGSEPAVTLTPTTTASPSPSATASPSPTATGTATATPSPTATSESTGTPTAPPAPTATPDDDNANDNGGDDNSNDNGGDDNDNGGDDNANDNGDDNANDNGGDNSNDNEDNSGSGGDNSNDNGDNSGSGSDNDNGGGGND